MEVSVSPAGLEDVPMAIEILAEASAWLRGRGIRQWPPRFDSGFIRRSAEFGQLYLVTSGREVAGTVTLQWSDEMFWGDRTDAGFLHRLAILRSHRGAGPDVIRWAEREVAAHDRLYLCLDTLTSNARLREYYEDLGFVSVGEMAGPVEHPHTKAHGLWRATLYEKRVAGVR
jgi:hypothetical protein